MVTAILLDTCLKEGRDAGTAFDEMQTVIADGAKHIMSIGLPPAWPSLTKAAEAALVEDIASRLPMVKRRTGGRE